MSEIVYLLECAPYDPVAGSVKNVFFSSGLDTEAELGQVNPYPVRLSQAFSHETSIFEENIPGQTNISVGSAIINNSDGRFDNLLDHQWDGRQVTVKKGLKGAAYGTFTTEFVGSSIEITADLTNLVLTLRDNSYKIAKPLQVNKYAGTGGAEGGSDLQNRRKPLLFGPARNLAPVSVDSVLLTMQVHDGALASVTKVFDKANALTFAANYTTYAALIAASVPPGYYATSLETGFIRLGAPPAGVITVDAAGQYNTATNIPELAKQILLGRGGLVTGDLNVPSFTEASSDCPQTYEGIYLQEPDFQVDEMLETLASAINGFWYVNRTGLITFRQFKFRTPVASVREEDLVSLGKAPSPSPLYRVRVNYAKNPTIMSTGDFVIPKQTFNGFLTRRYHYVDTSVGSPSYAGAGQFKVFLNDTQVNDLPDVIFRIPNGESWLTIDPQGNITATNPGTSPASAVVRAGIGEFFIDEVFTLVKDSSAPLQYITLTPSADRWYFDETGAPNPTTQTITIGISSSAVSPPITLTAVDNLGNNVTITGGNTILVSSLTRSPLLFWVEVTATSADAIVQKRRILVQHGEDAYAAGVLTAWATANAAVTFFYQTAAPGSGMQVDDVWVDTDDANKQYRWTGSAWVLIADTRIVDALTAAAGAQATADGKIKTFFATSAPTATAVGDLWYNSNTGVLYRWDGSSWTSSVATRNVNRGAWATSTAYLVGDFFTWQNSSYLVNTNHTSSGTSPDFTKADLFAAEGVSTWTMNNANSTGVVKSGITYSSLASYSGTWAAKFTSSENFTQPIATVIPSQTNKHMAFGFTTTPATSGIAALKYGVIFKADGTYEICLNGTAGTPTVTGSYTTSDLFKIFQQDDVIHLTKNGAEIHTFTGIAIGTSHNLIGLFNAASALMNSITFIQGAAANFWVDIVFKRSASAPATPTGTAPSGWSNSVPSGNEALWSSSVTRLTSGSLVGVWSTPAIISGQISPVPYNGSTTYYKYQTVTYNGGTYMLSVTSTSGNPPSGTTAANAYWDVIAGPGDTGPPATPPGTFTTTISIGAGTGLVNLRTLANTAGYTGSGNATITYNVTGTRTGNPGGIAIDTGTWPSSTNTITLTLNVQSTFEVRGGGGRGGDGAGNNGSVGGDAIYCQENITISNSGAIRGGGGGGGGGDTVSAFANGHNSTYGGGGGGGGYPNGAGGDGAVGSEWFQADLAYIDNFGNNGSVGTTSGGGNGGTGAKTGTTNDDGAAGGGAGAAGSNSAGGATGGAAGYAVRKNGKTVSASNGTVSGTWA